MNSTLYSGCYGGIQANNADILITKLTCKNKPISMSNKQVIFVVDESGSMTHTMPTVRASLLAFRNALLRLLDYDISDLNETAKDKLFVKECKSSLITFSDDAHLRWDSSSTSLNYSTAIENLTPRNLTNMGAALQLAYNNKLDGYVTWIILLTDGLSNVGSHQTVESFTKLYNQKPQLTTIIPLGYTTSFDVDILSVFGTMTYIECEEKMVEVFGCIVGEVVTSYGFNAKFIVPSESKSAKDVIGSADIGCLFNDRSVIYGFLPFGNKIKNPCYDKAKTILSYYDIKTSSPVTITTRIITDKGTIPDDIIDAYFRSSKARIMKGIYREANKRYLTKRHINIIKDKIDDWKHPCASEHKEHIMRLLNTKYDKNNAYRLITRSHATESQGGYLITEEFTTPTQKKACNITNSEAYNYF